MSFFKNVLLNLPEVAGPSQKKLSFKEKLKWTAITLVLFFILGMIPLFGLGQNALQEFEYLSMILGAKFGSIISLGIGPIVTASIVLQLLNGSGLIKFDLTSHEGKKFFQGTQKMLAFFFILFEAAIYVFMGGLAPEQALRGTPLYFQLELVIVLQLFIGGILVLFMDEIVSRWGFGSGISLFIVAGVSQEIFIRAFSWLKGSAASGGFSYSNGKVIQLFQALAAGDPTTAGLAIAAIVSTALVFVIAVYAQSMKVEIPLSFGRVRGYGIRWPLHFIYTSNIPVILVSALFANIQLWARLLQNAGHPLLGTYDSSGAASGIVSFIISPKIVENIIKQGSFALGLSPYLHAIGYIILMIGGSVLFSYFWVQTAGMDAKTQAKNIMASGLQIPGFRKDERILERLLNRYIGPLTIMGAIAIGFLAAVADLSGALSHGTGILLSVMIVYRLYEDIARQHMMDMYPGLRKMME
jgi:preprotein translocase subunit SecY